MTEINSQVSSGMDDPNAVGGAPVVPAVSQPSGSADVSGTSTISQSEAVGALFGITSSQPVLTPPNEQAMSSQSVSSIGGDDLAARIMQQAANTQSQIVNDMWDKFIETLREIEDIRHADDLKRQTTDADKTGPMSATQYLAYLVAITPEQRAAEVGAQGDLSLAAQFSTTYNTWMVSPLDTSAAGASGGYPSATFVAGAVASNPDVISSAIGFDSAALGVQLSVSPVADALLAVGPSSGLPGDYQAAAALIAALLNGGAFGKAVKDNVDAAVSGGKPIQDLNFAIDYAKNIMGIITRNIEGSDPTDPQQATQNNMIRLMLASMALNMLYRAGYGGMQGLDFEAILNGNTADIPDAIRGLVEQLAAQINGYLPKDSTQRAAIIARLMEYVDRKEPVDSMLETTAELSAYLPTAESGDITAARANSEPG